MQISPLSLRLRAGEAKIRQQAAGRIQHTVAVYFYSLLLKSSTATILISTPGHAWPEAAMKGLSSSHVGAVVDETLAVSLKPYPIRIIKLRRL